LLQTKEKRDYNSGYIEHNAKNISKRGKVSIVIIYIFILIVIAGLIILHIGQSLRMTHLDFEVQKLEQVFNQINKENHLLNIKLARDTSLAKVEYIARNELKMVEPDEVEILVLNTANRIEEVNYKEENNKRFFTKVFDTFLNSLNTVKADSLD
jgi:cell division protein FtsB